jgi:hypothetical protein
MHSPDSRGCCRVHDHNHNDTGRVATKHPTNAADSTHSTDSTHAADSTHSTIRILELYDPLSRRLPDQEKKGLRIIGIPGRIPMAF